MGKYTYDDIVTVKDILTGKVKKEDIIGKRGWVFDIIPNNLNSAPELILRGKRRLIHIDTSNVHPFKDNYDTDWHFFLPYKEPEKKYVPFDLSKEETRTFLRGKWIKRKSDSLESMITIIAQLTLGDKHVWTAGTMSAEELLDEWTFLDGSPCGKQIPSK